MNLRRLVIAFISLALLAAGYTGFWFYQAKRAQIALEEVVINLSQAASAFDSHFYHTMTRVEGFPFSFSIALEEPHFISDQLKSSPGNAGETSIEISSKEPLTLGTNILGNSLFIMMPKTMTLTKRPLQGHGVNHVSDETIQHLSFTAPPRLTFRRPLSEHFSSLLSGNSAIKITDILNSYHTSYAHSGLIFKNNEAKTPIIKTADVSFSVETDVPNNTTTSSQNPPPITLHALFNDISINNNLLGQEKGEESLSKPISFQLQTHIKTPPPLPENHEQAQDISGQKGDKKLNNFSHTKIGLNLFSIASSDFKISAFGSLKADYQNPLPYGKLSFKLDRPEGLFKTLRELFSASSFTWSKFIPEDKKTAKIIEFLSQISDNPPTKTALTSQSLMTFTVKRADEGPLMIGDRTYGEALSLFNNIISYQKKAD